MVTHYWIFNCTRLIINLVGIFVFFTINNLFRITRYSNIRIMCYNNNLTFLLSFTDTGDKFTINRLVIKIILWLIYDYRFLLFTES